MNSSVRPEPDFFQSSNVWNIAESLLGMHICTLVDGEFCRGKIVETEAYAAPEDKASHAYGLKRTPRNEVMYHQGGRSYVYLCYGMYDLFNVVTGPAELPHAVLIRAIEPLEGIKTMLQRRKADKVHPKWFNGPGKVSLAMGITREHNGLDLIESESIWIEWGDGKAEQKSILRSPRVGINYAEEYVNKPWRYRLMNEFAGK